MPSLAKQPLREFLLDDPKQRNPSPVFRNARSRLYAPVRKAAPVRKSLMSGALKPKD
jgi:hypothetical protein